MRAKIAAKMAQRALTPTRREVLARADSGWDCTVSDFQR